MKSATTEKKTKHDKEYKINEWSRLQAVMLKGFVFKATWLLDFQPSALLSKKQLTVFIKTLRF